MYIYTYLFEGKIVLTLVMPKEVTGMRNRNLTCCKHRCESDTHTSAMCSAVGWICRERREV